MDAEKTVGMSFRVTPRANSLLAAAAEHDRRSLTNMLEVFVEEFCVRNKIDETPHLSALRGVSKMGREAK
jgi:hypothetical protein